MFDVKSISVTATEDVKGLVLQAIQEKNMLALQMLFSAFVFPEVIQGYFPKSSLYTRIVD